MALPTEEELLARGQLVTEPVKAPSPVAQTASGEMPSEADLLSRGTVRSVGPASAAQQKAFDEKPQGTSEFFDQLIRQGTRQVGLTARHAIEGAPQLLDVVGAPLAYTMNKIVPQSIRNLPGVGSAEAPSKNFSRFADVLGLPKPETTGERVIGEATKQGFSAMAPIGSMNQVIDKVGPVANNVMTQLASNPAVQTVASAAGGGAGQTASEMGLSPGYSALANLLTTAGISVAGGRVANAIDKNYSPAGQRAMDLNAKAAKEGVELTAGDLGNKPAGFVEKLIQGIPGSGRDAFMQRQAEQTKNMLDRLASKIESNTTPGEDMISALRTNFKVNKESADELFTGVKTELAKVPGSEIIPASGFSAQAKAFLKEYPDYLKSSEVPESVKAALKAAANDTLTSLPYQTARDVRTLIGAEAKSAAKQGKSFSGSLDQIYKGLSDDFRGWAEKLSDVNPSAAEQFGKADSFYKANVLPYKQKEGVLSKIRDVVSPKATEDELKLASDNIMRSLFQPNKEKTAEVAMRLGGPAGEVAAQRELVGRGLDAGIDARLNTGVSPARFVNTLNLEDPMVSSVMGRNTDFANQVGDVSNIAQAAKRSVGAYNLPETGVQNKTLGILAGLSNKDTFLPTLAGLGWSRVANEALKADPVKGLLFANPGNPYARAFPSLNALVSEPQQGNVGVYDPLTGKQINRK